MWKLLVGIGMAALGVVSFLLSLQYGSLLTAAGSDVAIRERYNIVSALLGYGGIALFLFGVGFTIWAIRKMNAESREQASTN